jgi:ATP-dependent DNA helicase RecQ
LFFRKEDIGAQSFKTGEGKIDVEVMEQLVTRLAEEDAPVAPEEVAEEVGLSERKLTSALQRLEDVGAAETVPGGKVQIAPDTDREEAARAAAEQQERRREAKRAKLAQMRAYADATTCRREILLRYLGDDYHGPCNFCDNCEEKEGLPVVDPSVGTRREVA